MKALLLLTGLILTSCEYLAPSKILGTKERPGNGPVKPCTYTPAKIVYYSATDLNGSWNGTTTSSNNLWIMDEDGSNRTPLTLNTVGSMNVTQPNFNLSGSKIIYQTSSDLNGSWNGTATSSDNLWIMDQDGSNRTPLTFNTAANLSVTNPTISGDGTKAVYASRTALDGTWNGTATAAANIWISDIDGTNRFAITQNTTNISSSTPSLTNDNSKVIFSSSTDLSGAWDGTASSSTNIWIANSDGTGRVALTQNSLGSRNSSLPSLSPDGTKIVFISNTALDGTWNGTATTSSNVWIMNIDGSNRIALTQNTAGSLSSSNPVFSSDGTKIAFSSSTALDGSWNGTATSSTNIWVMNVDGSNRTAFTRNTAASLPSIRPIFSRDGHYIFFSSQTALDGTWNGTGTSSNNIWRINLDGTGSMPLTQNSAASLSAITSLGSQKWVTNESSCDED